jgi:hypothetical protein
MPADPVSPISFNNIVAIVEGHTSFMNRVRADLNEVELRVQQLTGQNNQRIAELAQHDNVIDTLSDRLNEAAARIVRLESRSAEERSIVAIEREFESDVADLPSITSREAAERAAHRLATHYAGVVSTTEPELSSPGDEYEIGPYIVRYIPEARRLEIKGANGERVGWYRPPRAEHESQYLVLDNGECV